MSGTDSAGHSGMDSCRIVLVPECDPNKVGEDICENVEGNGINGYYLNLDYTLDVIERSRTTYNLASLDLKWETNLLPHQFLDSNPTIDTPIGTSSKGKGGKGRGGKGKNGRGSSADVAATSQLKGSSGTKNKAWLATTAGSVIATCILS